MNPQRPFFSHLHALFLRIADKVDVLAAKEKAFFASCKRLKASERNDEYEKVNRDMSTSVYNNLIL